MATYTCNLEDLKLPDNPVSLIIVTIFYIFSFTITFFRLGFLNMGTIDVWDWIRLCWRDVCCAIYAVGCLAASLVPNHQMFIALPFPIVTTKMSPDTAKNCPRSKITIVLKWQDLDDKVCFQVCVSVEVEISGAQAKIM